MILVVAILAFLVQIWAELRLWRNEDISEAQAVAMAALIIGVLHSLVVEGWNMHWGVRMVCAIALTLVSVNLTLAALRRNPRDRKDL